MGLFQHTSRVTLSLKIWQSVLFGLLWELTCRLCSSFTTEPGSMAQIRCDTPPWEAKEEKSKRNIPRKMGTERWNKKKRQKEIKKIMSHTQRKWHAETDRHMHTAFVLGGWSSAEGCVREVPRSVSVLETVTMLFPASRSLAVPLSARGPTLHFSNAQTTQFWHLYSVQSSAHNRLGLAVNIHNETSNYS